MKDSIERSIYRFLTAASLSIILWSSLNFQIEIIPSDYISPVSFGLKPALFRGVFLAVLLIVAAKFSSFEKVKWGKGWIALVILIILPLSSLMILRNFQVESRSINSHRKRFVTRRVSPDNAEFEKSNNWKTGEPVEYQRDLHNRIKGLKIFAWILTAAFFILSLMNRTFAFTAGVFCPLFIDISINSLYSASFNHNFFVPRYYSYVTVIMALTLGAIIILILISFALKKKDNKWDV